MSSTYSDRYTVKNVVQHLMLLVAVAACGLASQATETAMTVTANRTQIYLGESVVLTVKVSGVKDPPRPDLSGIDSARVLFLDSQSRDYSQITKTDGRMVRTRFQGRVFRFEVTPQNDGRFHTGPITLTVDGRTLIEEGPALDVQGIETQDVVLVSVTPSRESVLVNEAFEVKLTISIKEPDSTQPALSPLSPTDPPVLNVRYLNGQPIAGVHGPDAKSLLGDHLVQGRDSPGFSINHYTSRRDPYDVNRKFDFAGFFEEDKARFDFENRRVMRNGVPYIMYTLDVTYVPKAEGSYTFGPAIFKGNVVNGLDKHGLRLDRRIFAVGAACNVRVVPPPEDGRPASYVGAVGSNLQAVAALDTQTCNVGDPLTLTLTLSGDVSMENVFPLDLAVQEPLTRLFRIYEDSVQMWADKEAKKYSYTVRPTASGTFELPPLEVSFYDTAARKYRTVTTRPIPVHARETMQVGTETIIPAVSGSTAGEPGKQPGASTISPLCMDPAGAIDDPIRMLPWHMVVSAFGPVVLALALMGRAGIHWQKRRRRSSRHRNAYHALRSALRQAEAGARQVGTQSQQAIWTAARTYFADRLDLVESGLTPADIRAGLKDAGMDEVAVDGLCDFLGICFSAGFTGGEASSFPNADDYRRISDILGTVQLELRRKRRHGRVSATLLGVFLCTTTVARADIEAERQFLWNAANSGMAQAQTPSEFLHPARLYAKLVDSGVRNGPLFYNLGTALLMAKQHAEAVDALLRAERYMGSTHEIRRNLLIALRERDGDGSVGLPWFRPLLVWHYRLPASVRVSAAAIAFACLWGGLLLRALGFRKRATAIVRLAVAGLLVFGLSALTSWYQERQADANRKLFTAPRHSATVHSEEETP